MIQVECGDSYGRLSANGIAFLILAVSAAAQSHVVQAAARSSEAHELRPSPLFLPNAQPIPRFFVPNDSVGAIAVDGDRLYIGGRFDWVGRYTGASALVDAGSGTPTSNWPGISGQVRAIAVHPGGGWILGGSFVSVGTEARSGIVRILPNGSLDPWDPGVPNGVRALAVSGSTLYIGGEFGEVDRGVPASLAAIDLTSGDVLPWNPSGTGWTSRVYVNALAATPNAIYVGGGFATTMGGAFRQNFAALDPLSAAALPPNPSPNGYVETILHAGSEVIIGGNFSFIGGRPIAFLASMTPSSGVIDDWNPQLDGSVYALAHAGNALYVGGKFHAASGQIRDCAAAFDLGTRGLLPWNPNISYVSSIPRVESLLVSPSGVYIAGEFRGVGGAARRSLARVNASTGLATEWTSDVAGEVHALASAPTGVVVGGVFELVGGEARAGAAALSLTSGELLPWSPNFHDNLAPEIVGTVTDIVPAGDKVYVAGGFRYVNGGIHEQLALIDAQSSALDPVFDPQLAHGFLVSELVHKDSVLYAVGSMMIAGVGSRNMAAFNSVNGAWIPGWDAQANTTVRSISLSKSSQQFLIRGSFNEVGSPPQPRAGVAAVDVLTGQVTPWNPDPNGPVTDIAPFGENVWISGDFDVMGGAPRQSLAQVDAGTGVASPFVFAPNAGYEDVNALARHGVVLFVGGRFEVGAARPYVSNLLALDTRTGQQFDWNPEPNHAVDLMMASPSHLVVTGSFTSIAGVDVARLAVFRLHQAE